MKEVPFLSKWYTKKGKMSNFGMEPPSIKKFVEYMYPRPIV